MPADSPADVIERPVQEMAVPLILHFHDNVLAFRGQAINVVHDPPVVDVIASILFVQKYKILDLVLVLEQSVQEENQ